MYVCVGEDLGLHAYVHISERIYQKDWKSGKYQKNKNLQSTLKRSLHSLVQFNFLTCFSEYVNNNSTSTTWGTKAERGDAETPEMSLINVLRTFREKAGIKV